jgi:hypothetical protein
LLRDLGRMCCQERRCPDWGNESRSSCGLYYRKKLGHFAVGTLGIIAFWCGVRCADLGVQDEMKDEVDVKVGVV